MPARRWSDVAVAATVVALAAAIRVPALFDGFWFDEVWSWSFARQAASPLDVLRLAHDNNHFLNTLYLWLLGDRPHWYPYRLLALVTGLAAIPVAMRLASTDGRCAALVTGLLFAVSYLMTVFGTSARGYAPAMLCALGTLALLDPPEPRRSRLVAFWAVVLLGFASQLSFGFFYAAVLAWSAWRVATAGTGRRGAARAFLAWHAVPLAALAAFASAFVPRLQIGGGPRQAFLDVARDTVAWTFGVPAAPVATALGALFVAAVLAADVRLHRRRGSDLWVLDLAAVVPPLLLVAAFPPPQLYPRYFLMGITVLLLALGRVLGDALARRGATAAVAAVVAALVCAGNAARLVPFLRDGRGRYAETLRYVLARSDAAEIQVAANDDFDTLMMLGFYWPRVGDGKPLRYFRHADFPPGGTEWFLVRTYGPQAETQPTLVLAAHAGAPPLTYSLERVFPFDGGDSGWHWSVYRRAGG